MDLSGEAQAHADAVWLSMLPFNFYLLVPPYGGVSETGSSTINTPALGSIRVAYDAWHRANFASALADAIHDAASSLTVTINYLLATTGNPPAFVTGSVS